MTGSGIRTRPHAEVVVDGDHFTVLKEYARTTALAIHQWLRADPV